MNMEHPSLTPDYLDPAELRDIADAIRVLAHPHRLALADRLLHGRFTVGQLAADLDLAPNAVSQHLTHMKAHGILDCRRDGREARYRVVHPGAITLLRCIRRERDKQASG